MSNEATVRRFGEINAEHDLKGVYKLFLRVSSVPFVIKQTARMWNTYHDTGEAFVLKGENAKEASLVIKNYPDLPKPIRESSAGYIVGALRLTGAKNVQVVHDESDPMAWTWTARWD